MSNYTPGPAPEPPVHSPSRVAARRAVGFLLKTVLLAAAVYAAAQELPRMPAWGAALCWAALSALVTLVIAYPMVAKKRVRQHQYEEGRALARLNGGRTLCLIGAFVLAAVLVAGLMLEAPTWRTAEWVVAACSIPAFAVVFALMRRPVGGEFTQPYRSVKTLRAASLITGALLCTIYLVVFAVLPGSAETYATTAEAIDAAARPFAASPCVILREAGELTALVDGVIAMGLSETAKGSFVLYWVCKVLLAGSALFGVVTLVSLCALGRSEARTVFAPLGTDAQANEGERPDAPDAARPVGRYVALAAALPVVLAAAFVVVDCAMERVTSTEGYEGVRAFVREQTDLAAVCLDGTYYEYKGTLELLDQTQAASETLAAEAQETLVPLVNASFDARVANVDGYLDWYYSLPADYENLANLVLGTAEEFAQEQFTAHIEAGIDDTELDEQLTRYLQAAADLENELWEGLAAYEIDDVSPWLITVRDTLSVDDLTEAIAPTSRMLSAGELLGVTVASGTGGAIAGNAIAKQAASGAAKTGKEAVGKVAGEGVEKAAGKTSARVLQKATGTTFYKTVVEKIASKLGSKAVGNVIGGAVGTVVTPGIGTVIGAGVGLAASVGIDYAVLAYDEWRNRDAYRDEIVSAIEEERTALLAVVQPSLLPAQGA